MPLAPTSDLSAWGRRLDSEFIGWRVERQKKGLPIVGFRKLQQLCGFRSKDQVLLVLRGSECPYDWYVRMENALGELGIRVPKASSARRVKPPRDLALMSEDERKSIAADPEYWAWLCYELFTGTDGHPYRLQWFHVEVLNHCFTPGHKVLNLPTDHMKSTICCFLFPLLSLMNDPNGRHIIIGASAEDSRLRVSALQQEIQWNEKLHEYFPWVSKPDGKGEWTATAFNVRGRTINRSDPSVHAASPGMGAVKGWRGKLIMDDLEGDKQRNSPREREKLYDWVKLVGFRCYEDTRETPRPLSMICGTPFTPDSIYFKLEREGWSVIRYPVASNVDMETHCDGWDLLWPEKIEKVEDARKSLNAEQFSIAYLMDPSGGDPTMLSEDQIRALLSKGEDVQANDRIYVSLDPAAGLERGDYAGITVCAIDWKPDEPLPRVKVLRAHRFRGDAVAQVELCGALSEEFGGAPVIYERNAIQAGYDGLFERFAPRAPRIGTYTTQAKKQDRTMGLGILRTLAHQSRLLVVGSHEGIASLSREIANLGTNDHDHLCCSIWFCIRDAYDKRGENQIKMRSVYGDWGRGYVGHYGHKTQSSAIQREMDRERERFERSLNENRR